MYNFGLDDDQLALRDMLRRFVDAECARDLMRAAAESEEGFARHQWQGLGDLGVLGLAVPETHGGGGLGPVDLALAMEILGRAVVPAPVIETLVVAGLISTAGSAAQQAAWLPRLAQGGVIATYGVDELNGFWTPDAVTATAEPTARGYRLSGVKTFAPYGHLADVILCAARIPDFAGDAGVKLFLVEREQLTVPPVLLDTLDDGYRFAEIILDGVEVPVEALVAGEGHGWEAWQAAGRLAAVLSAAEQLGVLERSLEMVVEYGALRTQFGKPIGSYQAMKHRCADLLIDLEASRGSVYYAAYALETGSGDVGLAVSSAKAFASDASVRGCEKALQSFGAIGFTWEHDIHFYLKRAKRLELTLGDATFHRELIAQSL